MHPKIIFWGTPEFADIILNRLLAGGLKIEAVVTQPDRPSGRKQLVTASPVKMTAQKHGLKILQPENLRSIDFLNELKALKPDLMIVAAYGRIIPGQTLALPRLGAINVHPSLLPKYRGASPVAGAILAGEEETGVTLILMDEEMDHGPILAQERMPISTEDTNATMHQKLAVRAAEMLLDLVPAWLEEKVKPKAQDHKKATFTKILKKEDGKINWQQPAEQIERQIRAFSPWPTSWTIIQKCERPELVGKKLFIHQAALGGNKSSKAHPGTIITDNGKIFIQCDPGLLELKKVQLESKKEMEANQFLLGYKDINGCQCHGI